MAKHTEGPWKWGAGWTEYDREPWTNGEYEGPKYADIQLHGQGRTVIPIRIDHHEIIWDSSNGLADFTRADRALIAAAPDLLAACKAAHSLLENMTTDEFSCGADKPIREKLAVAIQKAEAHHE